MLVAQQKRKENIAEYIIYMWQLEDLARAHDLDADALYQFVLGKANLELAVAKAAKIWYQDLCTRTGKLAPGEHLEEVHEAMQEMSLLHGMLLTSIKDPEYLEAFNAAEPSIKELKQRAGSKAIGELEACFNGIYGVFLLELQKKKVSEATKEALVPVREMLKSLSRRYLKMKQGKLELPLN